MMEQLGQLLLKYVNSKISLAGAGTQPAALAFGGDTHSYYSSNRRIYNNRYSRYKNNNGKLIWQNI
jgi:hypothetical protein